MNNTKKLADDYKEKYPVRFQLELLTICLGIVVLAIIGYLCRDFQHIWNANQELSCMEYQVSL